jgi:hypothetical protein
MEDFLCLGSGGQDPEISVGRQVDTGSRPSMEGWPEAGPPDEEDPVKHPPSGRPAGDGRTWRTPDA